MALAVEITEADTGFEDIALVTDLWRFPSTGRARIVMMVYLEATVLTIIILKVISLDKTHYQKI